MFNLMKLFKASMLALAIAGAGVSGFKPITSGLAAYQRAVELGQVQFSDAPKLMPKEEPSDQPDLVQSKFIFAWVTGADCILNRIRSKPESPWASLKRKLGGAEWTRPIGPHPHDDVVISIIIKAPEAPWETGPIISALKEHALFYAIDDGSGFMSPANFKRGNSSA